MFFLKTLWSTGKNWYKVALIRKKEEGAREREGERERERERKKCMKCSVSCTSEQYFMTFTFSSKNDCFKKKKKKTWWEKEGNESTFKKGLQSLRYFFSVSGPYAMILIVMLLCQPVLMILYCLRIKLQTQSSQVNRYWPDVSFFINLEKLSSKSSSYSSGFITYFLPS